MVVGCCILGDFNAKEIIHQTEWDLCFSKDKLAWHLYCTRGINFKVTKEIIIFPFIDSLFGLFHLNFREMLVFDQSKRTNALAINKFFIDRIFSSDKNKKQEFKWLK